MKTTKHQVQRPETPTDSFLVEGQRRPKELPSSSRYRLTRCIARGGMGAVYLGVQRGAAGFERPVAIKRTHAHLLGTPERRQLILQEARNASAVRHPNVVGIDDVEEIEDELLLVMAYVDGSSLSHLARAGRVPIGVVVSVIRDACAGLHAIHAATDPAGRPLGLLHRDISPQNILIGLDGTARIIDFGIAKSARDPSRTSKNDRRGKFGYMSPEYLALGKSTQAGDIFALGVVLWEALAGRRLFSSELNVGTLQRTVEARVPLLRHEDPRITEPVDAVLQKALARSPEERFPSAAELSRALEEALPDALVSRAEVAAHVARLDNIRPSIAPPRLGSQPDEPGDTALLGPVRAVPPVDDTTKPVARSEQVKRLLAESNSSAMTRKQTPFEMPEFALAFPDAIAPSPVAPSPAAVAPVAPAAAPTARLSRTNDVAKLLRRHGLLAGVGVLLVVTVALTYACIASYAERRTEARAATATAVTSARPPQRAPDVPTHPPVGSAQRRPAEARDGQR